MNLSAIALPPEQSIAAIVALVLGAIITLLDVGALSRHPATAAFPGLPFAVIAVAIGISGPDGSGLIVVAIGLIAVIALLLVPALETEQRAQRPEAAALVLLGSAGAIALASATDLVQAVVGLETLALSAATAVALSRGERALEAAFKYFVLGAVSLAGLLYGLGLIFLGSGSFDFPTASLIATNHLVLAGTVLVALGFAFELAIVPFQWGALDAYTAAAPGLAGFIMSASKLAAIYALGHLVLAAGGPIAQIFVWIGSITIIWGTFGALAARSLRRMLAYSALTHAGFIGLVVSAQPAGAVTGAFYAALYASMAMLVFAALSGSGVGAVVSEDVNVSPLGRWRSLALGLGLISLAGIPPTPGFWAKLAVLVALWHTVGPLPTVIAALGGVFSVLYYLRPLPDILASLRGHSAVESAAQPASSGLAVALAAVVVVVLSILPGLAWTLAQASPFGT